jgi:CRISPR-associated protein Cas6
MTQEYWPAPDDTPVVAASVDVVFHLDGREIPFDHGHLLWAEIVRVLPRLAGRTDIGVHPIRGSVTENDTIILSRRANLTLRVKREEAESLHGLVGATLDLDGHAVTVGQPKEKELMPYGAIHAYYVTTGHEAEADFAADIQEALKTRNIPCRMVCGKAHVLNSAGGKVTTYSLALYNLTDEQSISLQETGLGLYRELGCGLFVPHKSFAPVGG